MVGKFAFIYHKDGQIKALSEEQAIDPKITDGWIHTATVDAIVYLNYLLSIKEECDFIDEIQSLTTSKPKTKT